MKTLIALVALITAISGSAPAKSPQKLQAYTYMTEDALVGQGTEMFQRNYETVFKNRALSHVRSFLWMCAFPAGNDKRIEQIKALKDDEFKVLGFRFMSRDRNFNFDMTTPRYLHAQVFFEIPAAHGAAAVILTAAFDGPVLQDVKGYDIGSKGSAFAGQLVPTRLFKVPVELAEGTDSSGKVSESVAVSPLMRAVTSDGDCNPPAAMLKDLTPL